MIQWHKFIKLKDKVPSIVSGNYFKSWCIKLEFLIYYLKQSYLKCHTEGIFVNYFLPRLSQHTISIAILLSARTLFASLIKLFNVITRRGLFFILEVSIDKYCKRGYLDKSTVLLSMSEGVKEWTWIHLLHNWCVCHFF